MSKWKRKSKEEVKKWDFAIFKEEDGYENDELNEKTNRVQSYGKTTIWEDH